MNGCDSGKPICRRYLAYARSTTISSAGMRAATTRRLKSSFSTSPRKTRANASSKTCVQRVDLDVGVGAARLQAEVVDPDRRRPFGGDAVRALVEHAHAHVLEHRQAVGQRHRRAAVEQLEAQRRRARLPAAGRATSPSGSASVQALPSSRCRARRRAPRSPRDRRREKRCRTGAKSSLPRASPSASISACLRSSLPAARGGDEPRFELAHVVVRESRRASCAP